tara:strand:+ start:1206 stop:1523 length:318 start_codon:yes stop_codon:yes gene_type:complete
MNYPKPKKRPLPKPPVAETPEPQNPLAPFVQKQVLDAIGKIDRMVKIRAKNVFNNNWRVNIWCEVDSETELCVIPQLKIKYSYFVRTDEEGKIIDSDPALGVQCQ